MTRHRYLAWPAYQVALILIAIPIVETTLSIWPLHLDDTRWRFAATGLFSRALLTPLLGLLVAFVLAFVLEHRVAQRVLGVLSTLLSLALAGVLALFLLDAVQMRAQVNPDLRSAFDLAALLAVAKYLAVTAVTLSLGVCAVMAARKDPSAPKERSNPEVRLAFRPQPALGNQEAQPTP